MTDVRNQNNPQPQQPDRVEPTITSKPGKSNQDRPDNNPRAMEKARRGELGREVPGSPFSFMQRFMQEMDRLFDEFPFHRTRTRYGEAAAARGIWAPQVDVFERGDKLVVHADLAGLRQEDVRVTTDEGILTIAGERHHEHEHEKGGVYQCERSYGTFYRSIQLPEGVDPETIRANFDNGVLEVTMPMPKARMQVGRSIPIGNKPGGNGGVQH